MGRSKDLASGETRFVNTAGDTMTGNLGINETSPSGSLHVKGTSSTHGKIILEAGGSGGSANNNFMEFNKHDGTKLGELEVGESVTNGGSLVFKTTPSGGSATTRMTINHDGIMTKPNQPSFQAYGSSAWQTVSSGNTSVIALNVAHSNVGNHYNTSNYRFTAPVAGQYLFSINCYCRLETHDDDSNHAYVFLRKNGATYINAIAIYGYYNSGDVDQTQNVCCLMTMAAGDYATADLNAASGDASAYRGATTFSGFLVG